MKKNYAILEQYLRDNNEYYSNETKLNYKGAIKNLFTYCQKDLNNITRNDIISFLKYLKDKGYKQNTLHNKLSGIRSLFAYCLEEDIISKNPTLEIKQPMDNSLVPRPMDRKTLFKIREASADNLRDRAIIETLYCTGIRASELINILIEDIKFKERQIWIRKGKGNKERYVLFTYNCMERINAYLNTRSENDSPYLFTSKYSKSLTRQQLHKIIKIYVKKANVDPKISPHTFRHTFATDFMEKNAPLEVVAELLGHRNINNARIYTKLTAKVKKREYDNHH